MTEQTATDERSLLDTSVVIAEDVTPVPGVLAISAVRLAELHSGVLVARSAKVRAEHLWRLSILQHRFDALPLDEVVAASFGRLAAAVVEAGRQPHDARCTCWSRLPPTHMTLCCTPATRTSLAGSKTR